MPYMLVADLIRTRRIAKGLTQTELADRLGIARNTVSRWENADPRSKPEPDSRRGLAKVLRGRPGDYEWKDEDYEFAARAQHAKYEAQRIFRKMMDGDGR